MSSKGFIELHSNNFGIALQWTERFSLDEYQVVLIFKNANMNLSFYELKFFKDEISSALERPLNCCENSKDCSSIILITPLPNLRFVFSYNELIQLEEVVSGALFQLNLSNYIKDFLSND